MQPSSETARTLLESLPLRSRLIELARSFGVAVPQKATKAELAATLVRSEQLRMRAVVSWMARDELRAGCQALGLDASGRARQELAARLLQALGVRDSVPPPGLFGARVVFCDTPVPGDIALVRQRQYLVEDVVTPEAPKEATRVDLVCLDDDAQGAWERKQQELECDVEDGELKGVVAGLEDRRRRDRGQDDEQGGAAQEGERQRRGGTDDAPSFEDAWGHDKLDEEPDKPYGAVECSHEGSELVA